MNADEGNPAARRSRSDAPEPDPVLLPLLFITPAVAFIVTLPLMFAWALAAAIVALVAAAVVGAPALALARRLGLRGWLPTALLGLAAGATSFIVPSLVWNGDGLARVNWHFAIVAALIGGATGGVYSVIHDTFALPPPIARRRMVGTVLLAVALAFASLFWRP